MRKYILLLMSPLLISKFGYCQPSDTMLLWSLANDTSVTKHQVDYIGKGERFGNKIGAVNYIGGYQQINPAIGWTATVDTTLTAGSYLDFPFRINPSVFQYEVFYMPFTVSLKAYLNTASTVKLSIYLYDSSLYYDTNYRQQYQDILHYNYLGTGNGVPPYYTFSNGHWYIHYFPYIDSFVQPDYQPYESIARVMKIGEFNVTSTDINNPDTIDPTSTFQGWLNLKRDIVINNERVVFARVYISSSNPSTIVNIKDVNIGSENAMLLPISFNTFTATKNNNNVQLNWLMKDEINIDKYIVEKAVATDLFKPIKIITINNNKANYSCIDENPVSGENLYRIKAVSKDGKITYSNTLSVLFGTKYENLFISPNPVKDVLNVQSKNLKQEKVLVQIVDITGKIIMSKQQQLSVGENIVTINIATLSKGIYSLVIVGSDSQSIQFVKE